MEMMLLKSERKISNQHMAPCFLPVPVCSPCYLSPSLCWSGAAASHDWSAYLLKQQHIYSDLIGCVIVVYVARQQECESAGGLLPAEAADSEGTGSQAWYGWCVWTLSLLDTRAWISLSTSPLITASFLPNLGASTERRSKRCHVLIFRRTQHTAVT